MKTTGAVLMVLLAVSGVARAQGEEAAVSAPQTPFSLSLDLQTQWRQDESYRLLSRFRDESSSGFSLSYDVVRRSRGALVLGVGYQSGTSQAIASGGAVFDKESSGRSSDVRLEMQSLALSAAWRWSLRPWLEPLLKVAVDGTWSRFSIGTVGDAAFSDHAWAPGASVGAGLRLRTSPASLFIAARHGFGAAVAVEGGYHLGGSLSYALSPPTNGIAAGDRIPVARTPIGDLGRSFPYLRLSFALLF